jgi:hypothetical protein
MINFIAIINIDTPTWPLPTNTNVPKHTQNSYGMCYLHTTNIFLPTLLVILFIYPILFLFLFCLFVWVFFVSVLLFIQEC